MPEPIITTVESSEGTVKAIRQEIPLGVGGEAIQRIPYSESLERLLKAGVTSRLIASTTRCIRIVEIPVKGGGSARFHCSRACVKVGNADLCPDHDREAFQPNQTERGPRPQVTNSASIKLTPAELAEMKITGPEATVLKRAPSPRPKPKPKSVKPKEKAEGSISITLSLDELDSEDWQGTVTRELVKALDALPASTIAHMKRIVALQERLTGGSDA